MDIRYPVTQYLYRPLSLPVATVLARTSATPMQVTWVSAVVMGAGAVAFARGAYVMGALLTVAGVIADCADGDLARISGRTSRAGAFLDSVLDRWTDAAIILGLALSDQVRFGAVAGIALVAALLTSYTRARAQSLGVDCPDGVGGRDARILTLVLAALFGFVYWGLLLVAVLGIVTSIHRTIKAAAALRQLDRTPL